MFGSHFLCCAVIFCTFIGRKTIHVEAKHSLISAGFSNDDPYICRVFNDNLTILWNLMEQNHLVDPPMPDSSDIHDLTLLMKAFLEHRKVANKNKEDNELPKHKRIILHQILNEIKDVINKKNRTEWSSAIVELITYHFRQYSERLENISCHKKNDDNLKKYTERAVEKYLVGRCSRTYKIVKPTCSEETVEDFTDIMKSIIQRYIVGSYCRPDETKRTFLSPKYYG